MAKTTLYGGRWRVVESLSEGGQGWVYRVVDAREEFQGEFALKRLKRKDRIARFRGEVDVLRRLQHESIVKLVDAQVQEDGSDDASFLVMPIARHGDLERRLALYTDQIESVVQVALQIARALDVAHKAGVIHRDIKPSNILFPDVGHGLWVSDFGLSLDRNTERNTPLGEVVGPRLFIAPELAEFGAANVTPAADIYSLGQLIFYMLSGGQWVSRENVFDARYAPIFSKGHRHGLLRLLLAKMIATIDKRYSHMDSVIRELEQIEAWEKNAVGSLLDPHALASTSRLQQKVVEDLQRKAQAETIRKSELELLNAVAISVTAMLTQQMEAQVPILGAGAALFVNVLTNEPANRRPLKLDTGNDTLLEERDLVSITVRLPNDQKRRVFSLLLFVCNEARFKMSPNDENYLGLVGNPMMAVLPMYEERTDHLPPNASLERGFFFGRHRQYGVPDPVPIMSGLSYHRREMFSSHYQDGTSAITRFNAAEWPAARDDILKMVGEVLSRMMRYISDGQ